MKFYFFFLLFFSFSSLIAQDARFDVCPLKVGMEIPDGPIVDQDNQRYQLKTLAAEKPSIIIFYRGAWCGYCTKHLSELNEIKDEIEKLGFQIFGITIDEYSKLEESTKRAESEIPVFSDSKAELIKQFGLNWRVSDELNAKYKNEYKLDLEKWSGQSHQTLPVPAVFIIKEGVVQFQYVNPNHSTRLKPDALLAILKTI